MPKDQWKRCGCHPAVRSALDIIEGSGLKANSRRIVERCISEDVSAASGRGAIRQKLEGCLSTRIEINPETSKAITSISTVLATRPPVPHEVCNWNRCVYGPQAKCDEPACISMPFEQWSKCGCHPAVRSALDVIIASGLKDDSRKAVERCVSEGASRQGSRIGATEIATGLRKCVATRLVVDEPTSTALGNVAAAFVTERASADDICNWNRCVYGPTARCEGDQRIEVCDGIDNDSDGQVDEEASDARVWYKDDDGDGVGVPDEQLRACRAPVGYAATVGDCCDRDPNVFPGQTTAFDQASACGSFDFDCDGQEAPEALNSHIRCGQWPDCGPGQGWERAAPATCGTPGPFVESCTRDGMSCRRTSGQRRLHCR